MGIALSGDDKDLYWMRMALKQAQQSASEGEVPVGAVLVKDGECLAQSSNRPIAHSDPTAHAEILALREAGRLLGNYRLPNTTLYVTLEPCCMCFGAMLHARVKRCVYAASDPKTGILGTCDHLHQSAWVQHHMEVMQGPLSLEASMLLRQFFKQRRLS